MHERRGRDHDARPIFDNLVGPGKDRGSAVPVLAAGPVYHGVYPRGASRAATPRGSSR
jgi:hypothetical protein